MDIQAVGVVGSRDYLRLDAVRDFIYKISVKYPEAVIVSGYARGVDRTAELSAISCTLRTRSYRPVEMAGQYVVQVFNDGQPGHYVRNAYHRVLYYPSYGEAAKARNTWIVRDADVLVAFWDEHSTGTADALRKVQAARKTHYVYGADGRLISAVPEQRGLFELGSAIA